MLWPKRFRSPSKCEKYRAHCSIGKENIVYLLGNTDSYQARHWHWYKESFVKIWNQTTWQGPNFHRNWETPTSVIFQQFTIYICYLLRLDADRKYRRLGRNKCAIDDILTGSVRTEIPFTLYWRRLKLNMLLNTVPWIQTTHLRMHLP